jgi:hypothetical protein
VRAEAVERARRDVSDTAVPDVIRALGEREPADLSLRIVPVEEAELHRGGVLAPHREVDTAPVPRGAERGG